MRNNLIKIFIGGLFLFIPAFVFGQGSGSSVNYPEPPSAGVAPIENNFVITRSANGKIAGISKGILVIKDKRDKEIRVIVTKNTKFKLGKKNIKIDELDEKLFALGNDVKVTYIPSETNPKDFFAVEIRFPGEEKSKEKPGLTKT